jgi:hypothetical protein
MSRFKTGEDIVKSYENAGFSILYDGRPYSDKDPNRRTALAKDIIVDDETKNVTAIVWRDKVEIIFPSLERNNHIESKSVVIDYKATKKGLVQSKVQSVIRKTKYFE